MLSAVSLSQALCYPPSPFAILFPSLELRVLAHHGQVLPSGRTTSSVTSSDVLKSVHAPHRPRRHRAGADIEDSSLKAGSHTLEGTVQTAGERSNQ